MKPKAMKTQNFAGIPHRLMLLSSLTECTGIPLSGHIVTHQSAGRRSGIQNDTGRENITDDVQCSLHRPPGNTGL